MSETRNFSLKFLFPVFLLLFSLQVIPSIFLDSLTNDEPTDIVNGYYYLTKGDVVAPQNHPPLGAAFQALPLLALDLKDSLGGRDVIDRAHFFLFKTNLDQLSRITLLTRLVSWLAGCLIGFLLYRLTRTDPLLSFFTLVLWALEPTTLALSGLAKTDIVPALFFFLAVLAFQRALEKPGGKSHLLAGLAAGLAVASKFYCLVLIPAFVVIEGLEYWRNKKDVSGNEAIQNLWKRWSIGFTAFTVAAFLVYLPGTLLLPDHREPFAYLFQKLKENMAFAHQYLPVYFLGSPSQSSHWTYFPAAFLLKEPLPFLAFLAVGIVPLFRKGNFLPDWMWVPPLAFGLAILPAPNMGVRYLLPAVPFLILIAGRGAAWLWRSRLDAGGRAGRLMSGGLTAWLAFSVLLNAPHALSYFNELVPGDRKLFYLGDSNLDWGQDTKRLARTARERGWKTVRLAYLGSVDPKVYGMDWEPWKKSDEAGPQPGRVYAVNASFIQLAPFWYDQTRGIASGWAAEKVPTGKVGDSWYYFEIPGTPSDDTKEPFLPSAPFLQYRGYTTWTPSHLF